MPFAPQDINDRIQQQLQNARREDAANHRSGDAFHHVRARLRDRRPHDGQQTKQNGAGGHDFGADALHRTLDDGGIEVAHGVQTTGGPELFPRLVEIEQHDDSRFRIQTGQRDETHPHGDAHVVIEQVKKPKRAHQRERNGQQNDGGSDHRFCVQINQRKNDEQRERYDKFKPLLDVFDVFKLPRPLDVIAGRKFDTLGDAGIGGADVAVNVMAGRINKNETDKLAVLVANVRRSGVI